MKKFYVFLCTALLGIVFPAVLRAATVNIVKEKTTRAQARRSSPHDARLGGGSVA